MDILAFRRRVLTPLSDGELHEVRMAVNMELQHRIAERHEQRRNQAYEDLSAKDLASDSLN